MSDNVLFFNMFFIYTIGTSNDCLCLNMKVLASFCLVHLFIFTYKQ